MLGSLARFTGSAWSGLATDFDQAITGLVLQPDGTLEVAGSFAAIGTTVSGGLARLPLPSVHPAGLPGCTLWVDDDVLLGAVVANGSVVSAWAIPAQPALVGGVFHHQVVAVELVGAATTQVSSSNAVTATIGVF